MRTAWRCWRLRKIASSRSRCGRWPQRQRRNEMASIALRGVGKTYPGKQVQYILRDVDFTIGDGEFVVLVGPSGCGKSTLLRMIAGLEEISAGEISIAGERVNDVPPAKRGLSMVFQ